jgi:hypothetical protein
MFALMAASVPLCILVLLFAASRRFRWGVMPWKASLVAFSLSVAILAYFSFEVMTTPQG